ncbi:glycosyltransferase family 2 protein [Seonamhaeicola sp. NFXS20]|uniref:glycosyltransferase family 2 protein n=1 Tax=Seonamhaeicola sp. NFXS20 TaxID=2816959 RepID=UPI003B8E1939
MLSILIPTYNYNAFPLAEEIHKQACFYEIDFELICIDDGSNSKLNNENKKINNLVNATFIAHKTNMGRSGIRNFLAQKAKFEYLLFLDADVKILNQNFLQEYIKSIDKNSDIIYGGIEYQKEAPKSNQHLRWFYGNKREALNVNKRIKKPYIRFLTLSFLIKKDLFNTLTFNTEIPNLRHEDTLFSLNAKKKNFKVKHINNPVLHTGLETSSVFLKKSEEAVYTLNYMIKKNLILPDEVALSKFAQLCTKFKLNYPITLLFSSLKTPIKKQLLSKTPSLLLFDFYRLGYFLSLNSKK